MFRACDSKCLCRPQGEQVEILQLNYADPDLPLGMHHRRIQFGIASVHKKALHYFQNIHIVYDSTARRQSTHYDPHQRGIAAVLAPSLRTAMSRYTPKRVNLVIYGRSFVGHRTGNGLAEWKVAFAKARMAVVEGENSKTTKGDIVNTVRTMQVARM